MLILLWDVPGLAWTDPQLPRGCGNDAFPQSLCHRNHGCVQSHHCRAREDPGFRKQIYSSGSTIVL